MSRRLKRWACAAFLLALTTPLAVAQEQEKVGERPYEMVWANRTEEVRDPIVDFESLDGWTVETENSEATFERSREEQMYGTYVAKLTYRAKRGASSPYVVTMRPPKPIDVPADADFCSCWIYGNNWMWVNPPETPRVNVFALLRDSKGNEYEVNLAYVNWREWFLCYMNIPQNVRDAMKDGAQFAGLRVRNGSSFQDSVLYFDSFCVFKEERKPLEFKLRAKPGIDLFEGQPLGVNAGEGRLPFPTTPDTILPDSARQLIKPATHFYSDSCDFVYEGHDGVLVYEYRPQSGNWSDLSAKWGRGESFKPCADGGVTKLVGADGSIENVEKAELLEFKKLDEGYSARWRLLSKTAQAEVEYRLQIKGKSLIIDTLAKGGRVPEVAFGKTTGLKSSRVFTVPYYLYDYGKRPGIGLICPQGDNAEPIYASAHIDWYRSGASYLRGEHGASIARPDKGVSASVILNGGAEYRVKTDGKRNDVYERFILTFSPSFEETLPTIANPASPYRAVAGKGVWRAHGATTREGDKAYWSYVQRRGIRHMIVTDHEVCWRDGGESFTFRTKPAPKKGGDEGWIDYSRFMQDTLGYVYGLYNNFTDFAPVNEYWSPDMINRNADWSLGTAWARCYAPKPTRAVEYCEKLSPLNEEKFKFSCAYCDVHSSVPAWTRTDYDERVPGAGTFMSVFYPYGEIFLLQKQAWGGPTYSEGPHHCFYAGLTDGNYAQDQPYNMFLNPWLVDFDLLKMHDLEVDFGMGNVGMFAPGYSPQTDLERVALIDRFNAATLAFGHSGFFAQDYGLIYGARTYFMIQQIASYYTQASIDTIRYYDADGVGRATSEALALDIVRRSQIALRYKDGTIVVSNGSTTEPMRATIEGRDVELPPNGYVAWTADGKVLVESFMSPAGVRFDYCESPEYIWFDGRGSWVERRLAEGVGAAACLFLDEGIEIIPYDNREVGFRLDTRGKKAVAVALAEDRSEIGPATLRVSRGFTYVVPVPNAVSYMITTTDEPATTVDATAPFEVAPGEKVSIQVGDQTVEWTAPNPFTGSDFVFEERAWGVDGAKSMVAKKAAEHVWADLPSGDALDFLVVSPYNVVFRCEDGVLKGKRYSFVSAEKDGEFKVVELAEPTKRGKETIDASFDGGDFVFTFMVDTVYDPFEYDFMDAANPGRTFIQRDGQEPTDNLNGTGSFNRITEVSSLGDKKIAHSVHPPYLNGPTGCVYFEYDVDLPADKPLTLRAKVGKGDGSDPGNGIVYRIAARRQGEPKDKDMTVTDVYYMSSGWAPIEAGLGLFVGEKVTLSFIADAHKDSTGDWACWADIRLETTRSHLERSLTRVAASF